MRILFVVPASRAGTVQYTHNLANALSERDHEVAVISGIDNELAGYARAYELLETFDRFLPRPIRLFRAARFIRRFRPHIVHMQGAQHPGIYLWMCRFLKVMLNVPIVYSPQDVLPNKLKLRTTQTFRKLYAEMSFVFLNAQQNLDLVVERFRVRNDRIRVLPIPDLMAFVRDSVTPKQPDIDNGRLVVLCFGLIEPRKGVSGLIQAFSSVHAAVPNAQLCIVGKPYMDVEPLYELIRTSGLSRDVTLTPRYVSFAEMSGLFRRADLVVLPYESGWNSGVLSTALGFGKPVIATTVGGFREVIEDGVSGMLVPPGDREAIASAMIACLKSPELRERLGRNAHAFSEQVSWQRIALETESVYAGIGAA